LQVVLLSKSNLVHKQSAAMATVPVYMNSKSTGNPEFWLQRVSFLQNELSLLQQRMELLQAEVGSAVRELQSLVNLSSGDATAQTPTASSLL
jgi:hypothetical protein